MIARSGRAAALPRLCLLVVTSAFIAIRTIDAAPTDPPAAAAPANREELTKRLGDLYNGAWVVEVVDDPFDTYFATGVASDGVAAFLREAAEIVERLRTMPAPRWTPDFSQGFGAPVPHLPGLRAESRALALLGRAAAMRGDADAMGDCFGRAIANVRNAAGDGIVVSSLVAQSMGDLTLGALAGEIDEGRVGQATAALLRGALRPLADPLALGLGRALEGERAFFEAELAQYGALDPTARMERLKELVPRKMEPGAADASSGSSISDDELAKDLASVSRYYDEVGAALSNPDHAAAKAELARLAAEFEAQPAGPFSRVFALRPETFERVLDRAERLHALAVEVDGLLRELESGAKSPEELACAASLYVRAAEATARLSPDEQQPIEVVRRLPSDAPDELAREARDRIRALRRSVIEPVLEAAKRGRANFVQTGGRATRVVRLAEKGSIGSTGAMRIVLADALDERPRGADDVAPVDAAIAVLHAVAHYANAGLFVHSVCAELMARDLVDALATLEARGAIDAAARERIRRGLARFRPGDPFGWRRAADAERARLIRLWPTRLDGSVRPDLETLDANETFRLVAVVLAFPDGCLIEHLSKPCECEGPLLDIRPEFDLDALTAVFRDWRGVDNESGTPDEEGNDKPAAARGAVPLDVLARTRAQADAFAPLARFGDAPGADVPKTEARPQ